MSRKNIENSHCSQGLTGLWGNLDLLLGLVSLEMPMRPSCVCVWQATQLRRSTWHRLLREWIVHVFWHKWHVFKCILFFLVKSKQTAYISGKNVRNNSSWLRNEIGGSEIGETYTFHGNSLVLSEVWYSNDHGSGYSVIIYAAPALCQKHFYVVPFNP